MPINFESDVLVTLAEAARELPGSPAVSTLHRWRLRGVRGVRLKTLLTGGIRRTCGRWLRDFFDATTSAAEGTNSARSADWPPSKPIDTQRRPTQDPAAQKLDKAGITPNSARRGPQH